MDARADVVVAGAGPTGPVLAGDLATAGVDTLVIEQRRDVSGVTRSALRPAGGWHDRVRHARATQPDDATRPVRPDGYVARSTERPSLAAASRALGVWCGAPALHPSKGAA